MGRYIYIFCDYVLLPLGNKEAAIGQRLNRVKSCWERYIERVDRVMEKPCCPAGESNAETLTVGHKCHDKIYKKGMG